MQSIKKFLKPNWRKLATTIGLPLIVLVFLISDMGKNLVLLNIFLIFFWPIIILKSEVLLIISILVYLMMFFYWYLLACLIILVYKKLKLLKFGKFIIAIIPIIIFLIIIFAPQSNPHRFDGRITSNMSQIRTSAVIYENNHNTYVGVCTNDDIAAMIADIDERAPSPASCFAGKDAYCVTVELNWGEFYCVDSNMNSYSSPSNSCTAENKSCK